MSARTETMPMIEGNTFLDRVFHTAVGRIFVVLTQTILVSLALLPLFTVPLYIDIQALKYTVVLMVGLSAGFSARRFLKGHSLFLKIFTAILAVVLSLMAQSALSQGFIGFQPSPIRGWGLDGDNLIQLGTAVLGAVLVNLAFRSRRKSTPAPAVSRPEPVTRSGRSSRPRPSSGRPAAQFSRMEIKEKKPGAAPKLAIAPSAQITRAVPQKKKKRGKSQEIHFIGEEKHTCPYCLDKVEKNDPRGVKICPICKTWHHADCWGITGACQIPHMHES